MMATLRRPHLREAGFTLLELLVSMAIFGLILGAVVGIFMVTQQSTLAGTAAEDAQVVTRVTLEQIVSDLQLISAGRPTSAGAILAASATGLTLLGDADNDTLDSSGNNATLTAAASAGATAVQVSSTQGFAQGELFSIRSGATAETTPITAVGVNTLTLVPALGNSYPVGSIVRSIETVAYTYTAATAGGTLTRSINGGAAATLATNLQAFQFTYWQGVPAVQIPNPTTQALRDQIRQIGISLTCLAQSGDRRMVRAMTTTVRPRNL